MRAGNPRGAVVRRLTGALAAACLLLALTGGRAAAAVRVGWGRSATLHVVATPVADPLASAAGPGTVTLRRARTRARAGEGVLALTMAAPGTSWRSARDPAAIAEVSVDGGPVQTIELFAGARRFTYEGFLGPLRAGRHSVRVLNSARLSVAHDAPAIRIDSAQLGIVPEDDPAYWDVAYAPFIYGRSSSATAYIPLLTDVQDSVAPDGSRTLSYTYIVSAHDQGDSIVPAYQWGTWGRMTDIVSVITERVAADGAVTGATYASCGCEGTPYPDSLQAPSDTNTRSFTGSWLGHHPMLRDATATNYLSQDGTTRFRFQLVPVAGPGPGEVRESVMDAHPWTYEISNEELPREHVISTNPDDLLVGDYRQYAIVDSDVDTTGTDSVQFDVRLSGSGTWYSTDYRQMAAGAPSTFAFHNGGHNRTVIKLPLGWQHRGITGWRIRLEVPPGGGHPTARVRSLRLLAVTHRWRVVTVSTPAPQVVEASALDPTTLPF